LEVPGMTQSYRGKSIEQGATSIKGRGEAPAIRWLVNKGLIKPGMKVLDYGAGKWARNADYLRKLGCKVYAYDPHNYNTNGSGYTMGAVTKRKPRGKFDVAFSCFVLNVVPKKDAESIMKDVKTFGKVTVHVVRDEDSLMRVAGRALRFETDNPHIRLWYYEQFRPTVLKNQGYDDCIEAGNVPELLRDFCRFGFQTDKKKWQRAIYDTTMRRWKYRRVRRNANFRLFVDEGTAVSLSK
jgi:hypothetical protein